MATYNELVSYFGNAALRRRVRVAVVIAAQAELSDNPGTTTGRAWGLAVLNDPKMWGDKVLLSVLAANKDQSSAVIDAVTDTQIQSAVDAVVPNLIGALSGT